jgi:hypothetical protein
MTPSREGAPTFADIFVEEAANLKAASDELDDLRALVLSNDGQARPISERTAAAQLAQGNAAAGRAAIASRRCRRARREAILNSWGLRPCHEVCEGSFFGQRGGSVRRAAHSILHFPHLARPHEVLAKFVESHAVVSSRFAVRA